MAGALALTQAQTADLLEELQHGYQEADRGLTLRKAAGGWQLVTKEEALRAAGTEAVHGGYGNIGHCGF